VNVARALTRSADATIDLATRVGALLAPGDLIVLAGDLGSGKTTFAKGIGRGLGVPEPIVSPTFTIVREYEGRLRLVHVDVYRLDHVQELNDLGLEELAGRDAVTIVEWGDVIAAFLPSERLEVRLEAKADDNERLVALTGFGPTWDARRDALEAAVGGSAIGESDGGRTAVG
jgi:tRNA threonylcarbamoyladenosine biosynthesis protein TsaE